MDIVMTRRGRELYAVGEFVPAYYAFCDDEIIYEAATVAGSNQVVGATTYSGGIQLETQNRTAQRIKDAPRLKLQSGTQAAMGLKGHMTSSIFEPRFKILGKSSNIDEEAPAWQVKVVNERGLMSGSVKFVPTEMSGALDPASGVPIFKDTNLCTDAQMLTKYNGEIIPQISIYCDYDVQIVDVIKHLLSEQEVATYKKLVEAEKTNKNLESQVALSNFKSTILGPHGGSLAMMLKKSSDDIVLDFAENNVDYTGYTLEVYEYQYNKVNDITGMKQLNFSDEHHGTNFVEYFFDISTDKEAEIDLQIEFVDESLFEGLEEEDIVDCPPGQLPTATAAQIKPPLGAGEIPATPPPKDVYAGVPAGGACSSNVECVTGHVCKGVEGGKGYISKFGKCVPHSAFAAAEKHLLGAAGKCDVSKTTTALMALFSGAAALAGLGLVDLIKNKVADKITTKSACDNIVPDLLKAAKTDMPAAYPAIVKAFAGKALKGEWTG